MKQECLSLVWSLVLFMVVGCTPVGTSTNDRLPDGIVLREHNDCLVTVLIDLSGSFEHRMTTEGHAYRFCTSLADRYFRDKIGTKNHLVIAQISNTDRVLLWQGTPAQLRREFATPEQFNAYIKKFAVPSGSRVFDGIAQTVEYVASDPDVSTGKAKSAVLVLSDMEENGPTPGASLQRMKQAIATYSQCGGSMGVYYVDQRLVAAWRNFMRESGLRNWCVEADIVGTPQLPSFD